MGTHLFLVYWLLVSPQISNSIIIPWNLGMGVLVFLLFYNYRSKLYFLSLKKQKFLLAISLFIAVSPIFSLWGKMDKFLTFHLYSGNGTFLIAEIEKSDFETEKFGDI
jgi:phosphoglycerol transferase MdoB-like AlkP superfamily enzyme